MQIQTDGSTLLKNSVTALWGSKAMDNIIPLDLDIEVEPDSASVKRRGLAERCLCSQLAERVLRALPQDYHGKNDWSSFQVCHWRW